MMIKRNVYAAPFIGICIGALECYLAPLTGATMIAPSLSTPLGAFITYQILVNGHDDPTTSAMRPATTSEHSLEVPKKLHDCCFDNFWERSIGRRHLSTTPTQALWRGNEWDCVLVIGH
ncbi:hypothetical protein ACA910_014376 [Epithemia clementina (nom. ined.)]